MSEKKQLQKQMQLLEDEIKELEIKRSRSQASLIEALISRVDPNEDEVRFFRTYTAEIELKREQFAELKTQLKNL